MGRASEDGSDEQRLGSAILSLGNCEHVQGLLSILKDLAHQIIEQKPWEKEAGSVPQICYRNCVVNGRLSESHGKVSGHLYEVYQRACEVDYGHALVVSGMKITKTDNSFDSPWVRIDFLLSGDSLLDFPRIGIPDLGTIWQHSDLVDDLCRKLEEYIYDLSSALLPTSDEGGGRGEKCEKGGLSEEVMGIRNRVRLAALLRSF